MSLISPAHEGEVHEFLRHTLESLRNRCGILDLESPVLALRLFIRDNIQVAREGTTVNIEELQKLMEVLQAPETGIPENSCGDNELQLNYLKEAWLLFNRIMILLQMLPTLPTRPPPEEPIWSGTCTTP